MSAVLQLDQRPHTFKEHDIIMQICDNEIIGSALILDDLGPYKIRVQMFDHEGVLSDRERTIKGKDLIKWSFNPLSTRLLTIVQKREL